MYKRVGTILRRTFVLALVMVLVGLIAPWPSAAQSFQAPPDAAQEPLGLTDGLPGVRFVHQATVDNIISNWTYIDHYLTNGNPNAIFFVTQNWNPAALGGVYNDHNIGVWYDSFVEQWAIFNQDEVAMPPGSAFSILIPDSGSAVFVHQATAGNTVGNSTYIDHAETNNNPDALVYVTQNWNPGGVGGTYNDHAIGVWYDGSEEKWAVFNQDGAAIPEDAAFNVVVAEQDSGAYVHMATADNILAGWTYLDHPQFNDNPHALIYVTQNWNPGGVGGVYNNHAIGVWYDPGFDMWAIFNQDGADMPDGAAFNILSPSIQEHTFVHHATAGNIIGNWTLIDNPESNGEPDALVFATQNWNPGGAGGTYNNHNIGVWYDGIEAKWAIFNQDEVDMTVDAAFNVHIPNPHAGIFVHEVPSGTVVQDHTTYIDHVTTNGNPNAIVFITQNWNPGGVGGTYNDHPIGVWYDGGEEKWSIFNQDLETLPAYAAFNVMVPPAGENVFVHQATVDNISSQSTYIDHPLTNHNPTALLLVTQNWNPGGEGGVYNDHPIGVWYNPSTGAWAIFNEDLADMPEGASFNVMVVTYRIYVPIVLRGV